jgi:hypothetical protein
MHDVAAVSCACPNRGSGDLVEAAGSVATMAMVKHQLKR